MIIAAIALLLSVQLGGQSVDPQQIELTITDEVGTEVLLRQTVAYGNVPDPSASKPEEKIAISSESILRIEVLKPERAGSRRLSLNVVSCRCSMTIGAKKAAFDSAKDPVPARDSEWHGFVPTMYRLVGHPTVFETDAYGRQIRVSSAPAGMTKDEIRADLEKLIVRLPRSRVKKDSTWNEGRPVALFEFSGKESTRSRLVSFDTDTAVIAFEQDLDLSTKTSVASVTEKMDVDVASKKTVSRRDGLVLRATSTLTERREVTSGGKRTVFSLKGRHDVERIAPPTPSTPAKEEMAKADIGTYVWLDLAFPAGGPTALRATGDFSVVLTPADGSPPIRRKAQLHDNDTIWFRGHTPGLYRVWIDLDPFIPLVLDDFSIRQGNNTYGRHALERGATLRFLLPRDVPRDAGKISVTVHAADGDQSERYVRNVFVTNGATPEIFGLRKGKFRITVVRKYLRPTHWRTLFVADGTSTESIPIP